MLITIEAEKISSILKVIKEVNHEVLLSYEDDKLLLSCSPSDNTTYLLVKVAKSFFKSIEGNLDITLINIEDLLARLRFLKGEVNLDFNKETFIITQGKAVFKLPQLDPSDKKHRNFYSEKPDAVYILNPAILKEAVEKALLCSDLFLFTANDKELTIETYDGISSYKEDLETKEVANGKGRVRLTNYVFKRVTALGKLSDNILFNIYNDKLLTINCHGEGYSLNYMVAVRADNN